LLLAAICILAKFTLPILQIQLVDHIYDFDISGINYSINGQEKNLVDFPFFILIPALAIFSLLTIFLYNKQHIQLKMGRLNYILILLLIVMIFFSLDGALEKMENKDVARISYQGFYFPVAAIAFIFLANRSIKRELEVLKILENLKKK
jgi:hypothetical protein